MNLGNNQDNRTGYMIHNEYPPAVLANMSCGNHAILDNFRIRRLTPTECAKLQTIPEWYKWQCSNTQQYKMLGNGWTVEVIKHIFGYMIE